MEKKIEAMTNRRIRGGPLTATTFPSLGSITRSFLSLQVDANRLPSLFHAIENIVSLCSEMMLMGSAISVFHNIHCNIEVHFIK